MTDRELLELAAKAAGLIGNWHEQEHLYAAPTGWLLPSGQTWNPLTDDGDALRLAVKLRMVVDVVDSIVVVSFDRNEYGSVTDDVIETIDDDPYAATRRTIVRAAAEIGKGMP